MQSEREYERAHMEAVDATLVAELDDVVDQSMRVEITEVTYIPCVLSPHLNAAPTRAGLRKALADGVDLEFVSKSHLHRYGARLDGYQAVAIYGPVAFEVRDGRGALIAVVDYCAHPAFGDSPVRAEVTGRVR